MRPRRRLGRTFGVTLGRSASGGLARLMQSKTGRSRPRLDHKLTGMGIQKIFDVKGHAHFTTINVYKRIPILENYEFCDLIIENLEYYRKKFQFKLLGHVILPDHLHTIVLPDSSTRYSDIIRDFKKGVAFTVIKRLTDARNQGLLDRFLLNLVRRDGQRYSLWQRKYFDFNIFQKRSSWRNWSTSIITL